MNNYELNHHDERWDKSQKAEVDFWKKGRDVSGHFTKDYWLKEFRNYGNSINIENYSDKNILEVGCGPKGIIHYISGRKKVGMDPLIEEYRKLEILEDGGVEHVKGVGEKIDFPAETFDLIVCFNVLDHSDSPKDVCKEMNRVLAKKGEIIFHSHYIVSWSKILRGLLSIYDKPHPWHFTKNELDKMFYDSGLEIKFIKTMVFHWKSRNLLKHLVAKVIIRDYFAVYQKQGK